MNIHDEYNKYIKQITRLMGYHHPLSTTEINYICFNLFGNKYTGTYASDRIPKRFKYIIVNLDPSHKRGSHWVAMCNINNKIYVYDSFGRKTNKILPTFKGKSIMSDDDAEQKKLEINCGHRCISWLMCVDKYKIKEALKI